MLLAVIVALGDYRDGLFGGVMIANIAIGIVQEVRAKRTLDRLALLVAPHGRTWRDGELHQLRVEELVLGDVIRLEPGDQVVADGRLVAARALSLDESMLTGESEAVNRVAGDNDPLGSLLHRRDLPTTSSRRSAPTATRSGSPPRPAASAPR